MSEPITALAQGAIGAEGQAQGGLALADGAPAATQSDALAGPARLAGRPAWVDALSLAEGGLLADVGVILDLATIYLPVVGTVLLPAVPTPFALLMLRRGARATLLASAVATFLVTVLAGPHFGWRMGLEGLIGLLLGWCMKHRLRSLTVLAAGTLLVSGVGIVAALLGVALVGVPIHDIVQELSNLLHTTFGVAAALAGFAGWESTWHAVYPAVAALAAVALRYWPLLLYGYLVCAALPVVVSYYVVANVTARVLGHPVRPFPPRWLGWSARALTRVALMPLAAARWLGRRLGRRRRVRTVAREGERR